MLTDFINSKAFSGLLALMNGYFCFNALNHSQWGWALLSGFFCWLCAKSYFQRY